MIIPGNNLQRKIQEQYNDSFKQGIFETIEEIGKLIEVYDPDFLNKRPNKVVEELATRKPGTLWAKVLVYKTNKEYLLSFEENQAQIFSTYGNYRNLVGKNVTIKYRGLNIESGLITLRPVYNERLQRNWLCTNVYDIGKIL